jgi:hypothetical protein
VVQAELLDYLERQVRQEHLVLLLTGKEIGTYLEHMLLMMLLNGQVLLMLTLLVQAGRIHQTKTR